MTSRRKARIDEVKHDGHRTMLAVEREPKLTVQVRHLAGEQFLRHAVVRGLG